MSASPILIYRVNVEGYSSASFTPAAIDYPDAPRRRSSPQAMGFVCSLSKKKIGIADTIHTPNRHGPYSISLKGRGPLHVTDITFSGVEVDDKKWLMKKCNLQENSRYQHCDRLNRPCISPAWQPVLLQCQLYTDRYSRRLQPKLPAREKVREND